MSSGKSLKAFKTGVEANICNQSPDEKWFLIQHDAQHAIVYDTESGKRLGAVGMGGWGYSGWNSRRPIRNGSPTTAPTMASRI